MRTTYKSPLTIDQQVDYLQNQKRVVYNTISKDDAKEILYTDNYINVISPFKHYFAKLKKNGTPIKINGDHVYEYDVEFESYFNHYSIERSAYQKIFHNLLTFEKHFNAILSYEVIQYYHIHTYANFLAFQSSLKTNITSSNYKQSVKDHMFDELSGFNRQMDKYDNIYIFMDRLSLSNLIMVFRSCDSQLRNKIFNNMYLRKYTLSYVDIPTFDKVLSKIVSIRNTVCHGNSLDILINYYNIKHKILRTQSDRRQFINVINRLK